MKSGLQSENKPAEDIRRGYDHIYEESESGIALPLDSRKKILRLLDVKTSERFLDIGCGSGYLLYEAQLKGAVPFGIDISPKAIQYAQKRMPKAELIAAPAETLPWEDAFFDCLANVGSLEHFLDMAASLKESARVLKPKGRAIFLVPNSFYLFHVLKAWLTGKEHEENQWIERTGTLQGWRRLIEENGFRVKRVDKYNLPPSVMPWWYRPVYSLISTNMSWCFILSCEKTDD